MKDIIRKILFYISVPKCVSCNKRLTEKDQAFCSVCFQKYTELKKSQCSICFNDINQCSCTNDYLKKHFVKKLLKVYRYAPGEDIPTNTIIYSLKRDNRQDVVSFLANEIMKSISLNIDNPSEYVFTNVPRRQKTINKYGLDHAELLSKELARRFSAQYYQPIVSKLKRDQKKMIGEERVENANYDYKHGIKSLKKCKIILVDDIVTTGASMGAVATLLKGLGAQEIIGVSIGIAYKDNIT